MEAVVATSIEMFRPDEWNALFPGELEDWAYYRAVERAQLAGFAWRYFGVRDDGKLVAAVPGFLTDYQLDTTLTGTLRNVTDAIQRVFPRFLRQRMITLGSPVSEVCHLGFATGVDPARALGLIFDAFVARAKIDRAKMIAIKDSSAQQDALWRAAAQQRGLRRQPGLPTAALALPFDSVDGYLASLSYSTRKDIRRKLKAAQAIRVEWRTSIDDIIDEVMRLYIATRDRAEFDFEELTSGYFRNVLAECAPHAACATFWLGDRLVAFNLVLQDGDRLIDKFLGMDYAVAREYNLYFYTWIENVRHCIERGIKVYQSGQGLHGQKVRLGSTLSANWLWYRHTNPVLDKILSLFERLARLDRNDPQLAALGAEQST